MAVVFSKVTVSSGEDKENFLVGGIPTEYADLKDWKVFDDFLKRLQRSSEVSVCVEAYVYGEGETFNATPYEVANFQQRLNMRPRFLESSCIKISNKEFRFSLPQEKSIFEKFPFVEL